MKTLNYNNKTLHFISTAHVSKQSIDEVKSVIEEVHPDAVCIELDDNRAYALQNRDKQEDVDIKAIIKSKKVGSFVANLILSSYQKRIASELDTNPGDEMLQAIESAKEVGASVYYIDRDIQVTFQRIWRNLSFWKKINLAATLLAGLFTKEEVDGEEIENLKNSDLLYEAIKEMDESLPDVSLRLLHERNYYMSEKIKNTPGDTIVIVIGAAHTEGIIEALDESYSLYELQTVPEKKKFNIGGWIIPGTIIILLIALSLKNPNVGLQQFLVWMGLSSSLSAFGALLIGAHPFTILATFLSAPIGVLSPFLAVGFFAGLMEAYQRPPSYKDFDTLAHDATSPKMWFKNKVLRIVLILLVTNLLSSLGTFIAGGSIIKNFFRF